MKIDKKIIKELSDYLEEFNLTELEYTEKDTKIKVSKNNVVLSNPAHSKNEKVAEGIAKMHPLKRIGEGSDTASVAKSF